MKLNVKGIADLAIIAITALVIWGGVAAVNGVKTLAQGALGS